MLQQYRRHCNKGLVTETAFADPHGNEATQRGVELQLLLQHQHSLLDCLLSGWNSQESGSKLKVEIFVLIRSAVRNDCNGSIQHLFATTSGGPT